MVDFAFILGQVEPVRRRAISLPFLVALVLFVLLILFVVLLIRWIVRRSGRSLKARQDLARATADVADRLERIESKLEDQNKAQE